MARDRRRFMTEGRMRLGCPAILIGSTVCALGLTGALPPWLGILGFVGGAMASIWAWEAP